MTTLQYNLNEIKTFSIEPGKHRAKVTEIKQTLSKKGKPMLEWTWKIVGGPNKGQTIRSWTSLVENALGNLKNHLEALGFSGEVKLSTKKLVGRYAVLVIGPTVSTDDKGNDREFSNVIAVKPDGTPTGIDTKKKSKPIIDEDEDDNDEVDDDEVDDDEDLDDESETDDDEDDDEDEEPVVKKKVKPAPAKKKLKKSRRPVAEDDDDDDDDIPF